MTAERRLGLLAVVTVALGNLAAQPLRALRDLADTDYVYAFMTAGRMLHQGTDCLYCRDSQRAARAAFIQVVPTATNDLYTNPPLAAWLFQPMTLLPPELGLAVFLTLSAAAIAGAGWILAERLLGGVHGRDTRRLIALFAVATIPGSLALALANWDGLLLLAAAGAVWAAAARRPATAGALLAVLLVKPQLVWLVPLILLVTWQRRALLGFVAGAAVWVASTLLILGPAQLPAWAHNDLPAHVNEAHQTIGLPGIAAAVAGGGSAGFVCAALLLVPAAWLAWRMRTALRADLAGSLGLALAGSALCAPHIWPEDVLLLAVPLVLWARQDVRAAMATAVALSAAYLVDGALPLGGGHLEAVALAGLVAGLARSLVTSRAVTVPSRRAATAVTGAA